jgi:hypothetical protein
MAQFNLICHGMMLFVENERDVDILMPQIDEHDYRIGSPGGLECGPFPVELPRGHHDVTGIAVDERRGLGALHPDQHLLLHRDKFNIVRAERVSVTIPKPSRVRLFRPLAPKDKPVSEVIFGHVDRATALGAPSHLHDVVVLIYDDLEAGSTVRIGGLRSETLGDGKVTNVCIYSQVGPTSMPVDSGTRARHATGLNDLLELHDGRHPDFMLSAVSESAKPKGMPGDGIERCHLANLFDLAHFTTDGTGCSSAFVLRR